MVKNLAYVIMLFALLAYLGGCSEQSKPVDTGAQSSETILSADKIVIPENAVLESATFYIFSSSPNSQLINIHRITADWDEMTITWGNFGGAYAPEVYASFTPTAVDWNMVDVTTLVQDWLDGTYDNYGFVLDQVEEAYPRGIYYSRENPVYPPYLEVCYTVDGETSCEETYAIADAYIWEINATTNFGDKIVLFTGWESETDLEKQSVIKFEIETTPVEEASLGDYVWHDVNMDGIQDMDEVGISGVTVNLYDCQDNPVATTTTDVDGYYLFTGLTPGDYYVEFVAPVDYEFSPQDQGGDDAVDSDADPVTGKAICTALDADEHDMTWDAGLYMPPVEEASLGDYVWHDVNMDGIQDMDEVGISGVTVNLYDCQDVLLATTTTDVDGYYLFTGLTPGDYYVEFIAPFGYLFSPQDQGGDDAVDSDADPVTGKAICTTLDADEHDMTWDAGLYMPLVEEASLGDYVWHDVNMDGIQDMDEVGISGVTVNLYDCQDVLLATTTTDVDGYYLFTGLTPGEYYVEFIAPFGYLFSPQDQGGDDAMDSDADPVTGKAICTTLDADEHDMTWDAGLYMPVLEGCTHTIGYWKNHTGLKKQPDAVSVLLPIWLGNEGGNKSRSVTDVETAVAVLKMKTWGNNNNGITKLYAQLLGAKLSIADGADYTAIADYITMADDFLAENDWHDWYGMNEEDQQMILDWKTMFDRYNNGEIGPGHCDDFEEE